MNDGANSKDPELLKLQADFWLKRLDHTLTHTQTSSRLIYVVDGAVLALLYFAIQTIRPMRTVIFLAAFPTFLLVILNLLHARLIAIQHSGYKRIETELIRLLIDKDRDRATGNVSHPKRYVPTSAHGVYHVIHILIAIFLAVAAVVMFLYSSRGQACISYSSRGQACISKHFGFHLRNLNPAALGWSDSSRSVETPPAL